MADDPRFLARQADHLHPEQYVDNPAIALPHEPEAVDEQTQRQFSDESRRRWEVRASAT